MGKTHKKESKRHKKKSRSTSSSSSESDQFEWVERTTKDSVSSHNTQISNNEEETKQLERDEWMNMESFLPCVSKSDLRKQKRDAEEEEDKSKVLFDKPGQSERELNPYWKHGGNGLPQMDSKGYNYQPTIDANWLKKSLRRAEEQAIRDGKSLEEVAAERWGSLEAIQSMILKAERMSNSEGDKKYYRKYYDNKNHKDSSRSSGSRKKNRSRSRSRSRSNERNKRYSSHYSSQHTGRRQIYQKPSDNDDYHQQVMHRSNSSHIKNWKKDKGDDRKYESESSTSRLKETRVEETYNTNETDKCSTESTEVLSEAEMNKLGARIVKAEIMGDEELAAQLKTQLEKARKFATANSTNGAQKETVILSRTDDKGVMRPLQPRNQSKGLTENHKKRKIAETHISGERIRHFADDDKYSLQEMFEREKGRSANEDEAIFTKFASKGMDYMDDMFEQQIARTDLGAKYDRRDRMHAIKEHQNISKNVDNCRWCPDSKNMIKHMIVTMDSTICLSLPTCTSLITSHCILTPIQHVACQLQLDEDIWENLKEMKRKLTQMFTNEGFYPVFFEVYKKRCKFSHMQLECIPLPREIGETAPMYFKKALLECETEWSMNKKIVDLKNKSIRHAVPNGMSYFMIEFTSHPGYAHIIEDEQLFPKNFAEEVIGGMLDLDCNLWRKPKRQNFEEQREKVLEFTRMWEKA